VQDIGGEDESVAKGQAGGRQKAGRQTDGQICSGYNMLPFRCAVRQPRTIKLGTG